MSWRTGLCWLLLAACAAQDGASLPAGAAHAAAVTRLPAAGANLVQVETGLLRGLVSGNTREFLGIAYAVPPLAALRFAAPRPALPWAGERAATQFGPACMQASGSFPDMSEDCLTLNVFAPQAESNARRPVMVFIHGGGFVAGSSSTYDAKAISEAGDVVVVTLNYRLGPFGFLAHPALCPTGEPCSNQGLRDQQLALAWVAQNIAAFGGDPQNVTVFGESAGAISACAHLFAHGSRGRGQRFILQSGSCVYGPLALQSEPRARDAGRATVDALCAGAPDAVACLRAQPAEQLAAVVVDTPDPVVDGFWPWIDGELFDAPLEELLQRGALEQAPAIVGVNQNEWLLWQALGVTPPVAGAVGLYAAISRYFPEAAPQIAAHYTPADPLQANDALLRLMTDAYFRCPTRALARGLVAQGREVHLYEFAVQPAAHALEVDYVFNVSAVSQLFPFQAPDPPLPKVVHAMQGYWTQLAATGDPEHPDLPPWPPYDGALRHMVFQDPLALARDLGGADCDLWDALWRASEARP